MTPPKKNKTKTKLKILKTDACTGKGVDSSETWSYSQLGLTAVLLSHIIVKFNIRKENWNAQTSWINMCDLHNIR